MKETKNVHGKKGKDRKAVVSATQCNKKGRLNKEKVVEKAENAHGEKENLREGIAVVNVIHYRKEVSTRRRILTRLSYNSSHCLVS